MRKLLLALAAALGVATAGQAGPIQADVVFVIDESGSMGGVQANVRNNIGLFASILSAGGVDAQYALVGYGNSSVTPRLLTNLTTPANFATAAQNLQVSGGTEPAYQAIMAALNGGPTSTLGINFRAGAVKNIIIVTDEPSNGDLAGATFATADALLKGNNALLNGILTQFSADTNSNGGTLRNLVLGNGGAVFSLTTFDTNNQTVINNFVTDFANRKLQEIVRASNVPEPLSVAVFGGLVAVGGLAARRRMAAKA
jgi:hypothetical protein